MRDAGGGRAGGTGGAESGGMGVVGGSDFTGGESGEGGRGGEGGACGAAPDFEHVELIPSNGSRRIHEAVLANSVGQVVERKRNSEVSRRAP